MAIVAELHRSAHARRNGHARRGIARHAARESARFDHGRRSAAKAGLRGLQSAAGFLQSKIAEQIDTRYTPRLMFVLDQGVKKSIEMARILREVLPPDEMPTSDAADEDLDDELIWNANGKSTRI